MDEYTDKKGLTHKITQNVITGNGIKKAKETEIISELYLIFKKQIK